ncbi:MAG: LytTR family transcriptional regulator DNA-binding domain-containing protein [Erysipelotrichaceae bacterium]|nr:LytTR family transcriptional regulator DNA-binding domain-containing protein [Erysipelotrichaceae bacterium]
MRAAVIDQEIYTQKQIDYYNHQLSNVVVVQDNYHDVKEYLECLKLNYYDVVFIDIDLEEIDEFFYEQNKYMMRVPIVVMSASAEELMKYHKNNIIGYLRKPFLEDEFAEIIGKISYHLRYCQVVTVRVDDETFNLPINEIIYMETSYELSHVITIKGTLTITRKWHKKILDQLTFANIFRIEKSVYVNFDYITSYNKEYVTLVDGTKIKIGRAFSDDFRHQYNAYIGRI